MIHENKNFTFLLHERVGDYNTYRIELITISR